MTNENLLRKGRTLTIDDKAEWLVDGEILLVCYPSIENAARPDKFALLFHDNVRVGVVYFMGSCDIHALTFPEYRKKGYMSRFMRSGVTGLVEPELKMTTLDPFSADFKATKHLAKLAGLHCCQSDEEVAKFRRKLYDEEHAQFNAPCPCGSGEKYKCCCRDKDDMKQADKMRPCRKCNAYKSYITATRCWKCGADYSTSAPRPRKKKEPIHAN